MVQVIEGKTCPDVWLRACQYLMERGAKNKYSDYNVVLNVSSPLENFSSKDQEIYDAVNTFMMGHNSQNLDTIANTIFPAPYYISKKGKRGVFEDYPKEISKVIKDWGTYAHRMVRRKDENGQYFNPLEKIIDKINSRPTHGKCLELGLLPFDADMQLYDPREDKNRYIGGPCLSHISIKVINSERVNLTALYRNHFYIQRLLGNLIGLSQLLGFIAAETGLEAGELIIHSTSAEIDTGKKWSITEVKSFVGSMLETQKAA